MHRAAGLAVTAAFAVAACAPAVEPRGPDQANVRDEAKAVQGSGSRLDPCPSTGEAVTGDERLPALQLQCLGPGPDVQLAGLAGRPTLVNLWATWCGPCRDEMPLLQRAHERHGDRIRFLGVDIKDRPEAALAFLRETGVTYPSLSDPRGQLAAQTGIQGLPVTFVLDARGRVIGRRIGQLDARELDDLLDSADPANQGSEGT